MLGKASLTSEELTTCITFAAFRSFRSTVTVRIHGEAIE